MTDEQEKNAAEQAFIKEIYDDFSRRRDERKKLERGWQLNLNFVAGNQYCDINSALEIYEQEKTYFWQARRVFNHIAPVVDARCARLGRIRPALIVRAAGSEESDRRSAALASAILSCVSDAADLDGVISDVTVWAETCGTAFYKIMWDAGAGEQVGGTPDGKKLFGGDVKITCVPPFEIYPYTLSAEKLSAQPSIIHACAVPVSDIYSAYGVKLAGRDVSEFSLISDKKSAGAGYELLIERYERPTADMPDGRFTAVAGEKLLYDGPLPYLNGENGARDYPFVKQTSLPLAGSFFGASVVDRLIPVQRAYNAVKNRKHEFLNRFALGTVSVEDGSVDVDGLEEDGLVPGKIIVYRQGSKPPEIMQTGSIPSEFSKEEENLLSEFSKVSGTGNLTDNADAFAGITSATGLQIIIEQDEARLDYTYRQIKRALQSIGRQILRLYRQFAQDVRLLKTSGENSAASLLYFKGSDIRSDDVVLEADSETNLSPAQRRAAVYEMLDRGLFSDEKGNLTQSAKNKVLELLGYKGLGGAADLKQLNRARAAQENAAMKSQDIDVKSYDDHAAHVAEHTAFLLEGKVTPQVEARICAHIAAHEKILKEVKNEG